MAGGNPFAQLMKYSDRVYFMAERGDCELDAEESTALVSIEAVSEVAQQLFSDHQTDRLIQVERLLEFTFDSIKHPLDPLGVAQRRLQPEPGQPLQFTHSQRQVKNTDLPIGRDGCQQAILLRFTVAA